MNQCGNQEKIKRICQILEKSRNILFITGAGISADSGLPTYRGIGGLYKEMNLTEENISIELALSGIMMSMHPEITWKYIREIEKICRGATYNRGHKIICEMENIFERVWVFTQNVDGLHQRSGSKKVIDIHGDLYELYCSQCNFQEKINSYENLPPLPLCPKCGFHYRPNVVLFGEMLASEKIRKWHKELQKGFDIIFSVGTSSSFPYISEPVIMARHFGIPTVEINPEKTNITSIVNYHIEMKAAEALECIWALLSKKEADKEVDEIPDFIPKICFAS